MRLTSAIAVALLFSAWMSAAGQRSDQRTPSLAIESMTGRDSFSFYCAPCHGASGRGDGPVAAALKAVPPDLTQLAARAGGTYPRAQMEAFITGGGRPIPAHGSGSMPVWGPIFRSLDPSDTRVKIRIANLVDHLESIQAR
jgi:mono/diheme cytochrome c family protein